MFTPNNYSLVLRHKFCILYIIISVLFQHVLYRFISYWLLRIFISFKNPQLNCSQLSSFQTVFLFICTVRLSLLVHSNQFQLPTGFIYYSPKPLKPSGIYTITDGFSHDINPPSVNGFSYGNVCNDIWERAERERERHCTRLPSSVYCIDNKL